MPDLGRLSTNIGVGRDRLLLLLLAGVNLPCRVTLLCLFINSSEDSTASFSGKDQLSCRLFCRELLVEVAAVERGAELVKSSSSGVDNPLNLRN